MAKTTAKKPAARPMPSKMPAKKREPKPEAKHQKLLDAHKRHTEMANKHRAKADLIDAKLRVEGKRIRRAYEPGEKPKIVDDTGY